MIKSAATWGIGNSSKFKDLKQQTVGLGKFKTWGYHKWGTLWIQVEDNKFLSSES
jgi:hypothetical protein